MRLFLAVLGVSTVSAIVLWNFGLAHRIWPAHSFLVTVVLAALCGIVTQLLLSENRSKSTDRIQK